MRLLLSILVCLLFVGPLYAAVDIAPRGKNPVRLEDVYQKDGVPYLAIEDVIDTVGLRGHWDSVKHIFRIRTQRGWAEISPASDFLKIAGEYYPLKQKPRFIDGRLRVTDAFVLNQLPLLVGKPIYFRNLDPDTDTVAEEEPGTLGRLFSFLLNKKARKSGPLISAVAIDPGHGGLDTGVIAASGLKEKQVNLEVAGRLAKQLKMKLGVPIYLSRDGDYELTTEQRLQTASKEDVDLWLLLHVQAAPSPTPHGVCLFIRPEAASAANEDGGSPPEGNPSLKLADALALALREAGIQVDGIYPTDLLSLGRGSLPTVQVELGYLSNPDEAAALQSADYQERLALALYQGIHRYAEQKKETKNGPQ